MLSLIAALTLGASPIAAPALDFSAQPPRIAADCDTALARYRTATAAVATEKHPSFATVVLRLENAQADLNDALAADLFLFNVSDDKAVRQASLDCQQRVSAAGEAVSADAKVYAVLRVAAGKGEKTVYDRALRTYWLAQLKQGGAGLAPDVRANVVKLEGRLDDVQNRFQQHLADAAPVIAVDKNAVEGIPVDIVASYKRERNGNYVVPVDESNLSFLRYTRDEKARRQFFMAFSNRGAATDVPLFAHAIALRDHIAHAMGYQSWADYQLQGGDRMARSVPRVEKFLTETSALLRPAADADREAFRAAIAQDEHRQVATLEPWDIARGSYLVEKAHAVDENAVRRYFPVDHTIGAVLDFYHHLLGVDFTKIQAPNAWNADVIAYAVHDSTTHALLGVTYFDLYPRPGKFGHFANFPMLPARTVNGARRAPVATIVGNWPKPAAGQPALLSHDDVVTFFHEFGHDMAALLATAPYETLSNGFRTDFVEAPSQMLENFAWEPAVLKTISSDVTTGQPMSDDLIAKLVATRSIGDAFDQSRLIAYSIADLRFHSSGAQVDSTAMWRQTMHEYFPIYDLPQNAMQVSFGHLMGGYDAGLYAYPWARVYAQDLYSAFRAGGVDNATVGMRYRKTILEPARTYEPDQEVQAFLGRAMSPDAYLSEYGVSKGNAP